MFDRSIARIIDSAIAEVGRAEFNRLSDGLDVVQVRDKISYALNQLDRLNRNPKYVMEPDNTMYPISSMPDYATDDPTNDQWLALFYMLWYQPRQVLLARDVFSSLLAPRTEPWLLMSDRPIEVLDYGCGTLAGLFGLTIAAYESPYQGQTATSVKVFNHDSSHAMIALGRKLWSQFKSEVHAYDALNPLGDTIEEARLSFNDTEFTVPSSWQWSTDQHTQIANRIVSGLNCVYEENKDTVSADLASLLRSVNPNAFVLTGKNANMNYQLLGQVLPGRWVPPNFPDSQDSSYLGYDDYARQTTYLRRCIRENYMDTTYAHQDESFLRQRVPWSYGVASKLVWEPS